MKIAIINKWDLIGGAARSAYRLYMGLKNERQDIGYLVSEKKSASDDISVLKYISQDKLDLQALVQKNYIDKNRSNLSNTYYSFTYSSLDKDSLKQLHNYDVINLHWVEKLISLDDLQYIVRLNKPIVWTIHDEKPFTGGCHYTSGCTKFINNTCFSCPQLVNDEYNLANSVLNAKLKILHTANLTIVSPSRWLANEARKSQLFASHRIEIIPNSIETDIFYARPKLSAKQALNIKPDVVTIMFGAHDNKEKRKGFNALVKSIDHCLKNERFRKACADNKIQILMVGIASEMIKKLPINSVEYGYVDNDERLALIYSATDLYVLPTLEDNLPNAMLEAMACGTPIIAFSTGGVPDIVINRENGIIVDKENSVALGDAILESVFDQEFRTMMGNNAEVLIKKNFNQKVQADTYISLFKELLKRKFCKNNTDLVNMDELYIPFIAKSYQYEVKELRSKLKGKDRCYKLKLKENERKQQLILEDKERNFQSKLNSKDNHIDALLNIVQALNKLCCYKLLFQPVKKIKAYKNVLSEYWKYVAKGFY